MNISLDNPKRDRKQTDHEISVMCSEGDTKLIWDKSNNDEIENARRTFNDLRKKGFVAFKVTGKDGQAGEQLNEFDPNIERIIMSPPMQGG